MQFTHAELPFARNCFFCCGIPITWCLGWKITDDVSVCRRVALRFAGIMEQSAIARNDRMAPLQAVGTI